MTWIRAIYSTLNQNYFTFQVFYMLDILYYYYYIQCIYILGSMGRMCGAIMNKIKHIQIAWCSVATSCEKNHQHCLNDIKHVHEAWCSVAISCENTLVARTILSTSRKPGVVQPFPVKIHQYHLHYIKHIQEAWCSVVTSCENTLVQANHFCNTSRKLRIALEFYKPPFIYGHVIFLCLKVIPVVYATSNVGPWKNSSRLT